MIEIISFYEFKDLPAVGELPALKQKLKDLMLQTGVRGTIILAAEGYNGMVCGDTSQLMEFIPVGAQILDAELVIKSSFHENAPFRKIDVKIKHEIVTLKKTVDISAGANTHVAADKWNDLISDPDTIVLDARNDYEYKTGTFRNAINPKTKKFSDLPAFVAENLDPSREKRIAMFCTGGIRCEKFAPYLKEAGFSEVFQLEGGILKYLEQVAPEDSLWQGECFVFDERITVDHDLKKGSQPDRSQRHANRRKVGE